jgi:hypothetical protein
LVFSESNFTRDVTHGHPPTISADRRRSSFFSPDAEPSIGAHSSRFVKLDLSSQGLSQKKDLSASPVGDGPALIAELNTFEVDFTLAGNPRVDVRAKDRHGDLVIATALALWSAVGRPPGKI